MIRTTRRNRLRNERGQLLVMWLIFMLPMVLLCFGVFNVGIMVTEKMKVQTAADNAAYSAATWNARYLNQTAYINRAMVANYDTIAAFTGIWSFIDATDGFLAVIRTILRAFFNIGQAITPAAQALHKANDGFSQVIGGGKKNSRVGRALEEYNRGLSFAQQGLYIANQFGRGRIMQTIAWGVDPKIRYWSLSEAWGLQEMGNRRDWKKSDEEKGLRLTLERSLNELSNGGSFRDFDNFPLIGPVLDLVNLVPCLELTIGPQGFDGPAFNHVTGAPGGAGQVKIAEKTKIYQNDFNGLKIEIDCPLIPSFTLFEFGHNSDDARNLPNAIKLAFPHLADEEGDHGGDTFDGGSGKGFISRNVECSSGFGGPPGSLPTTDPALTQRQKQFGDLCNGQQSNAFVDIDGNNQDFPPGAPPLLGSRQQQLNAHNAARAQRKPPDPPIPSDALDDDRTCSDLQDEIEDRQEALNDKLKEGFKASANPCATIYEYNTPLADVKVTHYIQKQATPDGRRVEGPSVFVYLRKPAETLPLFKGLGLLNQRHIEAYAFGRAYYTQRPNNGTSERETAFNPFWAGRLEKAPILSH